MMIGRILACVLVPVALFAASSPTDLQEMRTIIDSPILNQILDPDESVFFIGRDAKETQKKIYILESTSHTIGVVVREKHDRIKPSEQFQFYAVKNTKPIENPARNSSFQGMFSLSEPIVAKNDEGVSQDPDVVRMRVILDSRDLYSELGEGRLDFIKNISLFNLEQMRGELGTEQGLGDREMALQDNLNDALLEKSKAYLIGVKDQDGEIVAHVIAFVYRPENFEALSPRVQFSRVPNKEIGQ